MTIDDQPSIYPPKLEEYIKKNKNIPRKMHDDEHLKLFHKYWLDEFDDVVKVTEVFNAKGVEYYSIRHKSMDSCTSYPVPDAIYELLHNNDHIEEIDIINTDVSYTGAEIKYWFIMSELDVMNPGNKYYGFWSFLNPHSMNVLVDNKSYYVSYDKARKQKCQVILDRSKL